MKGTYSATELKSDNKANLVADEMNANYLLTRESTVGYLDLVDTVGIPWFLKSDAISPSLRKRLAQWILKKFPASVPPNCGKCYFGRCTQTNIAECNSLLVDLAPDIPARFRPESLLSRESEHLVAIATAVSDAIMTCLPNFRC